MVLINKANNSFLWISLGFTYSVTCSNVIWCHMYICSFTKLSTLITVDSNLSSLTSFLIPSRWVSSRGASNSIIRNIELKPLSHVSFKVKISISFSLRKSDISFILLLQLYMFKWANFKEEVLKGSMFKQFLALYQVIC